MSGDDEARPLADLADRTFARVAQLLELLRGPPRRLMHRFRNICHIIIQIPISKAIKILLKSYYFDFRGRALRKGLIDLE